MASMKDVAKRANVGIATVSRVINNSGFVSKETRELVLKVIDEVGYVPNELARNFQKKQANMVGLIIPSTIQSFTGELTYHIEKELYNLGYHTLLCISNHAGDKELEYLEKLESHQIAGAIITAPFMSVQESYAYNHLPIVSIDRFLNQDIPCVHVDNFEASCRITEKLLSKAKQKVAYVGLGSFKSGITQDRPKGFRNTCIRHGRPHRVIEMHYKEQLIPYLRRVSAMTHDCDGYFFGCDYHAHKHIAWMYTQNQIVGRDFYVVSFDGLSTNKDYPYILTSVQQPFEALSKAAVQTLMKRINKTKTKTDIVLPYQVIEGDTC
ncbi:MAG: LacI family transcriptional regulator [Oscillospiraceae bacterium]|nr:LacI family transcriptional regulator [Oscillospiraceae bacterium]